MTTTIINQCKNKYVFVIAVYINIYSIEEFSVEVNSSVE
jgi:hypothetical protein